LYALPVSGGHPAWRGARRCAGNQSGGHRQQPVGGRRERSAGGEATGEGPGAGSGGERRGGANERRSSRRFRERRVPRKSDPLRRMIRADGGHPSALCLNQNWLRAARRCRGAAGCFAGMQVTGRFQILTGHPESCHNVSLQRTSTDPAGLEGVTPAPPRAFSFLRGDNFRRHAPHPASGRGPGFPGPAPDSDSGPPV